MEDNNYEISKKSGDLLNSMYDDFYNLFAPSPTELDQARKQAFENFKASAEKLDFNKLAELYREEQESTEKAKEDAKGGGSNGNNDPEDDNEDAERIAKEKDLLNFDERIKNSALTEDSKIVLKKMIEYAEKYHNREVSKYIPFNMKIYSDNNNTLYDIVRIIGDAFSTYSYLKNKKSVERSFHIVEENAHISDLYNESNSIVIMRDADGILNKTEAEQSKFLTVWKNSILEYSSKNEKGILTIYTDQSKQKIEDSLMLDPTLKNKIFDFELFTERPSNQEVYQQLVNKFNSDNYMIEPSFNVKLLDYVTNTYSKTTLSSSEFVDAVHEKIIFGAKEKKLSEADVPEYDTNKSIDEIFKELNELVGLKEVKQVLRDLVSLCEFKKKAGQDFKLKDTNLHMVFTGNPGTGKTTVARLVAGILYNLGYIKQNKLVEVSAKDLIGQYVGQTAPKTNSVVNKALGGVLFIDEAYSLASRPGNNASFNEECVATLIQAMENYRDNLVVIFAGYTKEMEGFLKSNSGIISRVGYQIEFKDYTVDELIEIFRSMFTKAGFVVTKQAIEKAKEIILKYKDTEGFGNARFVRTLYEKTIIQHAANTKDSNDPELLKKIQSKDISDDNIASL